MSSRKALRRWERKALRQWERSTGSVRIPEGKIAFWFNRKYWDVWIPWYCDKRGHKYDDSIKPLPSGPRVCVRCRTWITDDRFADARSEDVEDV